jgi:hypothetical protein
MKRLTLQAGHFIAYLFIVSGAQLCFHSLFSRPPLSVMALAHPECSPQPFRPQMNGHHSKHALWQVTQRMVQSPLHKHITKFKI